CPRVRRCYDVTIRRMRRFAGKVALVVGGTSGIGLVTAQNFAREGAQVVIAGRDPEVGESAAGSVEGECRFIAADVQDGVSIAALMERIATDLGGVDCAFNNAGWEGTAVNTAEIEESDWHRMIDIKLTGTWRCMKLQLEQMLTRGGGAIINMVGNFGLVGFPAYASYCAAAAWSYGIDQGSSQGIRAREHTH
ncbi:MAG: SDR family NAD(P)-dependent oxidoreductase, partial [Hyphomicrobium sp.]